MAEYWGVDRHIWAWIVAAVFTFFSCVLYVIQVRLHLLHNHHPELRKQTIRILTMVPIYSIESLAGLLMKNYELVWDTLRECYEAFVIYSFLHLIIEYLGGHDAIVKILSHKTIIRQKKAVEQQEEKERQAEQKDNMHETVGSASNLAEHRPLRPAAGAEEESASASESTGTTSSSSATYRTLGVVAPLPSSPDSIPQTQTQTQSPPLQSLPLPLTAPKAQPVLESMKTIADIDLYAIPISLRSQPHLRPFSWFMKPWTLPYQFLFRCRIGILQYVIVKIVMAIVALATDFAGVYELNQFRFDGVYIYVAFINNASQIIAMYCLVLFYMAVSDELKEIHPVPKFLCIKAVVFFTFWQSVLIAFLVYIGDINATQTYSTDDVSTGIQDFCICVEMLIAAIAHFYAFPAKEFESEKILNRLPETAFADAHKPMKRLLQAVSPMDMVTDLKELRNMEKHRKKREKEIKNSEQQTATEDRKIDIQAVKSPSAKNAAKSEALSPSNAGPHLQSSANAPQNDVTVAFVALPDGPNTQADVPIVVEN